MVSVVEASVEEAFKGRKAFLLRKDVLSVKQHERFFAEGTRSQGDAYRFR